ncbi:hypothetical protein A5700_05545 [Mycobacterium sp. E1214]|nr:hypothetical protein A5700_05545 [Mycobacterium sp. E1214]
MAAQLHPAADAGVQGQQHPAAAVVEHQGRRGDVAGLALAPAGVVAAVQERQHGVPQRILTCVGRPPVGEQPDRRLPHAHRRISRPSVSAGGRGPAGSAA